MTEYVISEDGRRIAFDRHGSGPAVILVGGAMQFRAFDPETAQLASDLAEEGFTVLNYDRPGRGETEGEGPYTLAGELAALRALMAAAGGAAALYGSSSGGAIALAAAAAGLPVTKLALWEVPLGSEQGTDGASFLTELRARVDADDREGALEFFMADMPPEWIEAARSSGAWPTMVSVAPSLVADSEALAWAQSRPWRELWSGVTVPVLVMVAEQTMPMFATAAESLITALPDARLTRVAGADHRWELAALQQVLAGFLGS
jgi:pimeloyl-ACP methyl ester carboxylesterase